MDHQNIILFGCLTAALAVSAFILWGPSPRPKKKKVHITGLVNLGSTCFLNTLLQALASCALFIQWLTQQKLEENSLTSALHEVLWVLNDEGNSEVHAPTKVLSALKRHGWIVPSGEQDAHELFHVIVSTLQEENKKKTKVGSLSDALPPSDTLSLSSDGLDDISELQFQEVVENQNFGSEPDILYEDKSNSEKIVNKSGNGDNCNSNISQEDNSCADYREGLSQGDSITQSSSGKFYSFSEDSENKDKNDCDNAEELIPNKSIDNLNEKGNILPEEKDSVKNLNKKFGFSQETFRDKPINYHGCYDRAAKGSVLLPQSDIPPFQGLLTSTLQCSVCGYYSSLHYDTFDSLSLPLGDNFHFQVLKLQDLLRRFVKTEIIPEVECEKCCKKTTAFKTMNFGKLPVCLCLHIARTTWQTYSHSPTKRNDYIDFPEYLPMDDYTVSAKLKKVESISSLHTGNLNSSFKQERSYKHLYRLKSVVVHLGGASSGHFLTYRRGALNTLKRHRIGKLAGACKDSKRWYLTSDDNVKMSTLCEAMESMAYLLFYEKCWSEQCSADDNFNQ